MEHSQDAFVSSVQRKQRRKRIRTIALLIGSALVLGVGAVFFNRLFNVPEPESSVLTYQAVQVSEGEISATLSGSGTLTALHARSISAPDECTVECVNFQTGDAVKAGETVMTLSSLDLKEDLAELKSELETLQKKLSGVTKARSSLKVTATKRGVVKNIQVGPGDLAEDLDYLCLISTDGQMSVTMEKPEGMVKYDKVSVSIGEDAEEGYVSDIAGNTATIVIDENKYDYGAKVSVSDPAGKLLGTGTLGVNEHVRISLPTGRIDRVLVKENQSVSSGKALFTLVSGVPSDEYLEYKEQESDLIKRIADIEDALTIKAEWDCILATLSVSEGDDVPAGNALCVLTGTDGYQLELAVDELDIGQLRHGQRAAVTLDALEGEVPGSVTNISFAGSGTYVTSYAVTVTTGPIEGAYTGMSASAQIVTATSGTAMILPVTAVHYEGDDAFVYLAENVSAGDKVSADDLDLAALKKVRVETGMSDGNYLTVSAEALSAVELVWQTDRETTAVYTDSDSAAVTTFTMGGGQMPGGQMPGGQMPGSQMPGGQTGGGRSGGGRAGEYRSGGN